jgi:hypothetical protein
MRSSHKLFTRCFPVGNRVSFASDMGWERGLLFNAMSLPVKSSQVVEIANT